MIKKFTAIPVIATMIAAKILGRAIDAVNRGFSEDPELPAQLSVYRAIQDLYPDQTVSIKEMYDSMVKRAERREASAAKKISGLTPEQQALWGKEEKESEQLLASIPEMLTLLIDATPDLDAWKDVPVVGQWAILSSVERSLPGKASFYKEKGGANFLALAAQIDAASPKYYTLLSSYLEQKGVSEALQLARDAGINVPTRNAA